MYLIHHTLFHHIYHYHRPSLATAATVLGLSILYAQAMRTFVELPIQRLRNRFNQPAAPLQPPLAVFPSTPSLPAAGD
jgi:peptidoglycan/LPS O-acetylase OafA/YrhL